MLKGCTPWPEEFVKKYLEKGYWEEIPLGEVISHAAEKFSNKEALAFGEERITFKEMEQKVNRLALHFLEKGLKPRDRVVFHLPNTLEFVYSFLGLIKVGIIPIMALPPHREAEISHFIDISGAAGYFIPQEYKRFNYLELAKTLKEKHGSLHKIFVSGEGLDIDYEDTFSLNQCLEEPIEKRYSANYLEQFKPDPYEVALIHLSGGTTALPKLIPRTHNDYVYNVKQSSRIAEYNENTALLAVLPMAHNYTLGSSGILGTWIFGGRTVIPTAIDPDTLFSTVEKEKVTIIPSAVPLIAQWVNFEGLGKYDISSLQIVQNGGARLSPELRRQVIDNLGCNFQEVFGTAEGLLNFTKIDDPMDMILTSSGRPISPDDEIKVMDDNENEVPTGEAGELYCRGPYTVRGYYNAPEHNKKAFTEDGFYRTGDLVRVNEEGFIFAEGRKKDVINRGGEKINAEEIEDYILSHPKIKNAAVVAMPDPVFGEKGCAYVMLKPGETLNFEEIKGFLLNKNIAKFKLPERLEVVEEFPLSPAGKILKKELRADIEKKLS